MVKSGWQRRDGSSKRVQLTSGDHGGPKGKKSKGAGKSTPLGGKAARLREVERFRESIRAAEQRRLARQTPPADTDQPAPTPARPTDARIALQGHLTACIQAAHDHDWSELAAYARQLAETADRLNAESQPPEGAGQHGAAR
ncbi:hypothetical protein ACWCPJ_39610 [Streptomyces collinus]